MALNSNDKIDRRRKVSAGAINDPMKSTQRDFKGGMNTVGAEISSSGQTSQEIVLSDPTTTWLGRVEEEGPEGESDYDDERYWIRSVFVENKNGDENGQLEFADFQEDDSGYRYVTASNLLEADLDEVHLVAIGTYVQVFEVYDQHSPSSKRHWVFEAHHTGLVEDPHIVPDDDYRWDRHDPPEDTLGVVINDVRLGAGGNSRVDLIFDHSGHLRQTCEHDEGCETSTTSSSSTSQTPTPTPTPAVTDPPTNPPPQDCAGVDFIECPAASGNKYYACRVRITGPQYVPDCNNNTRCDTYQGNHILTWSAANSRFDKAPDACTSIRIQGGCGVTGGAVQTNPLTPPCVAGDNGCYGSNIAGIPVPFPVGQLGSFPMFSSNVGVDCDGKTWTLEVLQWFKCV